MVEFIDKSAENNGTPLNRRNMMAIQGYIGNKILFNLDGSIEETNADGHTKTTTINEDGNVVEVFSGEKTITKTTIFNSDDSITEVIS